MTAVVLLALDAEFAPWRRRRHFREVADCARAQYEADINGMRVRVLLTGVGVPNAAAVRHAVLAADASICISAGLGGGLATGLEHGAIVTGLQVQELKSGGIVSSDARLADLAERAGGVPTRFVTVDQVVVSTSDKIALGSMGEVVEMESFHTLRIAESLSIPAVAIRAIGDTADETLPIDLDRAFDNEGRLRLTGLTLRALGRPLALPAVIRWGLRNHRAASRLSAFLDGFLTSWAIDSPRQQPTLV